MEIAIIGGGITGLTTALAFRKMGLACQVYEQTPQLLEVGAGIWMAPNAMKVFHWLGIGEEIRNGGISLERVEIANPQLTPLRKSNAHFISDADGNAITSIHRAKLQSILYRHLPEGIVHLNKKFLSCEERKDEVITTFEEGEIHSSLVLGADGLHSQVRNHIVPSAQTRYSGQTCWRGIAHITLAEEFTASCIEAWGNRVRFGFSVIEKDKVYWFAVARAAETEIQIAEDIPSRLVAMFADFSPTVKKIIACTPPDKIIRNNLCDLKRLPTWSKGRICLLGDAAHATTPNMGQGGAQGVEDAYYISQFLSNTPLYSDAFSHFERSRRKKVDYIVNTSWAMGKMIHHPMGQQLLKWANTLTPDKVIRKQMEQLYSIED